MTPVFPLLLPPVILISERNNTVVGSPGTSPRQSPRTSVTKNSYTVNMDCVKKVSVTPLP